MSSTVLGEQNPSPAVTRRVPVTSEVTSNGSQRGSKQRSLSGRLRTLFRRDSSSANRPASNDRFPPTTSTRQVSSSPEPIKSSAETSQFRVPIVKWPFSRRKGKLSATTPTPENSKAKAKKNRKAIKSKSPTMEISSPLYEQENRDGQNFVPRSLQTEYSSYEGLRSSSDYDVTTPKGFRNHLGMNLIPQSQQVVVSDTDTFTPSTYVPDQNPSLSMNRQRLPNANIERHYYNDSSLPQASTPYPDVDFIHTSQSKRGIGDTPSLANSQILTEKPPIFPATISHPTHSSNTNTNPAQWKSTSPTLNSPRMHSSVSPSMESDVPKLSAPTIPSGSTSSKKKTKKTRSQFPADGIASSSSAISSLVQQNPILPHATREYPYGSLPDAEIIHGGSLNSLKPTKTSKKTYPTLNAIVDYHLRPQSIYYNKPPVRTAESPQRPQRFDTSTTTLNECEQNQTCTRPLIKGSSSSTPSIQRHDGYIRPMTPQQTTIVSNASVTRVGSNDRGVSSCTSSICPSLYDSSGPPPTYRSTTTIYTRDRHRYVDSGKIQTWHYRENNIRNVHDDLSTKPYSNLQVERTSEQKKDDYSYQIAPSVKRDDYDEYRYSPRDRYENQQQITNDNDQETEEEEEEQYEVSYECERPYQQYSSEIGKHYDELYSINRYSTDSIDGIKNLVYSNPAATIHSSTATERDKIHDQSSRSRADNEIIQEPLHVEVPVGNSEPFERNYTLRRTNSYNGLGILLSTDTQTRSNHFIREIEPGSPADRAGLLKNDRILRINGVNVENVDFSHVLSLIKEGLDIENLQLSVIHEPEHI